MTVDIETMVENYIREFVEEEADEIYVCFHKWKLSHRNCQFCDSRKFCQKLMKEYQEFKSGLETVSKL